MYWRTASSTTSARPTRRASVSEWTGVGQQRQPVGGFLERVGGAVGPGEQLPHLPLGDPIEPLAGLDDELIRREWTIAWPVPRSGPTREGVVAGCIDERVPDTPGETGDDRRVGGDALKQARVGRLEMPEQRRFDLVLDEALNDRPAASPDEVTRNTSIRNQRAASVPSHSVEACPAACGLARPDGAPRRSRRPRRPGRTRNGRRCCLAAHLSRLVAAVFRDEMREPPAGAVPVDEEDESRPQKRQIAFEMPRASRRCSIRTLTS